MSNNYHEDAIEYDTGSHGMMRADINSPPTPPDSFNANRHS